MHADFVFKYQRFSDDSRMRALLLAEQFRVRVLNKREFQHKLAADRVQIFLACPRKRNLQFAL